MTIKKRDFYSTSEIAKLCHVHRNTIILAIRKGDLKASSTPGGHNRINHDEFVRFAVERGLPVLAFPGDDEEEAGGEESGRDLDKGRGGKKRVLVVDDDKMVHKLVEKALDSSLYEIAMAMSGYEGGLKTASFRPDLMLLDIMLGDIDGGEVYRQLKEDDEYRHIQILVITSIQDDSRIEKMFPEPVAYLKKPFRVKELAERVDQMLGVTRSTA
ncbi:MAG: response regulator [Planctomycetes bacterium]|nr:response regulator [Planctomycetota bacterium]